MYIYIIIEISEVGYRSGGENGKPLQYSGLENSMNSVKKQKDELLRSVGANMLLGKSREKAPERMKKLRQSETTPSCGCDW